MTTPLAPPEIPFFILFVLPWLRGWDSNPQPQGYEPCELPIALPREPKAYPAMGVALEPLGHVVARPRSDVPANVVHQTLR
jgi:hypothetical protein